MEDVNIFYYGGCGGFYVFHQLLLTDQFACTYNDTLYDIKHIKKQYEVAHVNDWKKAERWPNNTATLNLLTKKHKLFMTCGDFSDWCNLPGIKVFVYSDIRSHIRLAYAKKAYWFFRDNSMSLCDARGLIRSARDDLAKEVFIAKKYTEKNHGIVVKWQDIVTTSGLNDFFACLDLSVNNKNHDFLKNYLAAHPRQLLSKLKIGNKQ